MDRAEIIAFIILCAAVFGHGLWLIDNDRQIEALQKRVTTLEETLKGK